MGVERQGPRRPFPSQAVAVGATASVVRRTVSRTKTAKLRGKPKFKLRPRVPTAWASHIAPWNAKLNYASAMGVRAACEIVVEIYAAKIDANAVREREGLAREPLEAYALTYLRNKYGTSKKFSKTFRAFAVALLKIVADTQAGDGGRPDEAVGNAWILLFARACRVGENSPTNPHLPAAASERVCDLIRDARAKLDAAAALLRRRDPPKGSFEASLVSAESRIIAGVLTTDGAKRLLARGLRAVDDDELPYWKYALQIFHELRDERGRDETVNKRPLDTLKFSDFVVVMVELFSTLERHRAGDLDGVDPHDAFLAAAKIAGADDGSGSPELRRASTEFPA